MRGLLQSVTIALHTVLSGGEQVERAFNLGLAAILGSGVYNFGELVSVDFCVNKATQIVIYFWFYYQIPENWGKIYKNMWKWPQKYINQNEMI